nr:immunoglobulin heavy chain junction region [Macaca mulatta]MOX38762.1 immunoglobulin heavy chain junction region [Macaca mulatta]MOX41287.1 immunoglobulin heavy chain junction region [Macaca mulatta]
CATLYYGGTHYFDYW